MLWDWSTAGKRGADGKPLFISDDHGHLIYSAEKGDFKYAQNVRPEYKWYNGIVNQFAITDKVVVSKILEINRVEGDANDPKARIWPFKVMHGKQPYDKVNKTLVVNHVFGKDDTAFWTNFDYAKAIQAGMDYAGLPYSGEFGFIETRMNWFITHMVAPKEKAGPCGECHTRSAQGRLAGLTDFYMPGRDAMPWLDVVGWTVVALAILGGLAHALVRVTIARRNRRRSS